MPSAIIKLRKFVDDIKIDTLRAAIAEKLPAQLPTSMVIKIAQGPKTQICDASVLVGWLEDATVSKYGAQPFLEGAIDARMLPNQIQLFWKV